jgi:hypothetical protein
VCASKTTLLPCWAWPFQLKACLHETQNLCLPTKFSVVRPNCMSRDKNWNTSICAVRHEFGWTTKKIVSYDKKFVSPYRKVVFRVNTHLSLSPSLPKEALPPIFDLKGHLHITIKCRHCKSIIVTGKWYVAPSMRELKSEFKHLITV